MNMTLDELERKLLDELPKSKTIDGRKHGTMVNFVRYADDFIVTGYTKEFLQEQVLPAIRAFMSERGLQLSEEKTVITHIDDGFDFLGQNIRKYDGKLLIKPSKNAVKTFLAKVRKIVKSSKSATQEQLIRRLNPVIRGWVNYHRYVVSSEMFGFVDHQIYKCLWQWAKRRHKHKGHRWIAKKYWHHIGSRVWTFAVELNHANKGAKATYLQLVYATNTKIIRFRKIIGEANPFDEKWAGYYEEREGEKLLNSTKGRERLLTIWRTQNCSCPVCGEKITAETGFKTHTTILSETSRKTIMVHPLCHKRLHEPGYLL